MDPNGGDRRRNYSRGHEGRGAADCDEHCKVAGAITKALTRREGGNIRDGGLFYWLADRR
jgi:hypothetical protein